MTVQRLHIKDVALLAVLLDLPLKKRGVTEVVRHVSLPLADLQAGHHNLANAGLLSHWRERDPKRLDKSRRVYVLSRGHIEHANQVIAQADQVALKEWLATLGHAAMAVDR